MNKATPLLIPVLNNGMEQSDTLIETQAFMAAAMSATLLTTDKDFLPLNDEFIKVVYIDPKMRYPASSG